MGDLGAYAPYVLGAYGAVLALLAAIVILTLRANAASRRELERLEKDG